jgi:hypothetical protein
MGGVACQRVLKVPKLRIEVTCMDKDYIPEGRNTRRRGKSIAVAMGLQWGSGNSNGMHREIQQNTTLMKKR